MVVGALAGVNAHGLIVQLCHGHQMGTMLGVVVLHVGGVLEVVGVVLPLFHSGVGDHIVAIFHDFQGNALFLQGFDHLLEDFGVGGGGSAHPQGDGLAVVGGFVGLALFLSGGGGGAAGGQAQSHGQGQEQCKDLFHVGCFLLQENVWVEPGGSFISGACPFWWTAN